MNLQIITTWMYSFLFIQIYNREMLFNIMIYIYRLKKLHTHISVPRYLHAFWTPLSPQNVTNCKELFIHVCGRPRRPFC